MTLLSLQRIVKTYGAPGRQVRALREASLDVQSGEFVAIYGPSGSGKTTLLMLAAGLDRPTTGRVVFDGQSLVDMSERNLTRYRRRELGFIFQSFNLVPTLTALANVALPLRLAGVPRTAADGRASEMLDLAQLADRSNHLPAELSWGEMQRVAIARALVARPSLLLADEPTGNLDTVLGDEILELVATLSAQEQVAVILATHDGRAAAYASRIVTIQDGRLAERDHEGLRPARRHLTLAKS